VANVLRIDILGDYHDGHFGKGGLELLNECTDLGTPEGTDHYDSVRTPEMKLLPNGSSLIDRAEYHKAFLPDDGKHVLL
jgi:hypothetical protein